MSITQAERKLRQLRQLSKSTGWKLLEEIMREEIVSLALQTAKNPKMTSEEASFYAGCLQAAENLLNIIPNMEAKLLGEAHLQGWENRDDPNPVDDPLSLHQKLHKP